MNRKFTVLLIFLIVLAAIASAYSLIRYMHFPSVQEAAYDVQNRDSDDSQAESASDEIDGDDCETYLFLGSDSRKTDDSWKSSKDTNNRIIKNDNSGTQGTPRSDSMMLINVNRSKKRIDIVSIYRDTALNIASKGIDFQKANKAYSDSGVYGVIDMLERNLDIKIKGYASDGFGFAATNFKGVADMIDSLGGITVTIEDEPLLNDYKNIGDGTIRDVINYLIDDINNIYGLSGTPDETPHIKDSQIGKPTKLNGLQAVSYARVRYTKGSDMKRTVRQRTVLLSMINEFRKLSDEEKIQVLLDNYSNIDTDLSGDDFAELITGLSDYEINDYGFPFYKASYIKTTDEEKENQSFLFVPCDLRRNVITLHQKLYGEENYKPNKTIRRYSKALKKETGLSYSDRIKKWDYAY